MFTRTYNQGVAAYKLATAALGQFRQDSKVTGEITSQQRRILESCGREVDRRFDIAVAFFQKTIEDPSVSPKEKGSAYLMLGKVYQDRRNGNLKRATECFESASKLGNPQAKSHLALLKVRMKGHADRSLAPEEVVISNRPRYSPDRISMDNAIATGNYRQVYNLALKITDKNNWEGYPIRDVISAFTELGKIYYGLYQVKDHLGQLQPLVSKNKKNDAKAYLAFYTAIGIASKHPGLEAIQERNCAQFIKEIRGKYKVEAKETKQEDTKESPRPMG